MCTWSNSCVCGGQWVGWNWVFALLRLKWLNLQLIQQTEEIQVPTTFAFALLGGWETCAFSEFLIVRSKSRSRCLTFLYLATMLPSGLNTVHVLYSLSLSLSGIDPETDACRFNPVSSFFLAPHCPRDPISRTGHLLYVDSGQGFWHVQIQQHKPQNSSSVFGCATPSGVSGCGISPPQGTTGCSWSHDLPPSTQEQATTNTKMCHIPAFRPAGSPWLLNPAGVAVHSSTKVNLVVPGCTTYHPHSWMSPGSRLSLMTSM